MAATSLNVRWMDSGFYSPGQNVRCKQVLKASERSSLDRQSGIRTCVMSGGLQLVVDTLAFLKYRGHSQYVKVEVAVEENWSRGGR